MAPNAADRASDNMELSGDTGFILVVVNEYQTLYYKYCRHYNVIYHSI